MMMAVKETMTIPEWTRSCALEIRPPEPDTITFAIVVVTKTGANHVQCAVPESEWTEVSVDDFINRYVRPAVYALKAHG
jgi:hypothetical protein